MNEGTSVDEADLAVAQGRLQVRGGLAVACGIVGVVAAVWVYWLLVPGVVLGLTAMALGVLSWRQGAREVGATAMTLGVVAVFLVPSVLFVVADAEDWGRGCALNPSNPDC